MVLITAAVTKTATEQLWDLPDNNLIAFTATSNTTTAGQLWDWHWLQLMELPNDDMVTIDSAEKLVGFGTHPTNKIV
jgi:hypothetical protein